MEKRGVVVEICNYCKKSRKELHLEEIHSSHCPKSPNGRHYFVSKSYDAGTALADIFVALVKLLFSKPQSLFGLLFRGFAFGGITFCVASWALKLSFDESIVAAVAVAGLFLLIRGRNFGR